jgi:hypothetical protein
VQGDHVRPVHPPDRTLFKAEISQLASPKPPPRMTDNSTSDKRKILGDENILFKELDDIPLSDLSKVTLIINTNPNLPDSPSSSNDQEKIEIKQKTKKQKIHHHHHHHHQMKTQQKNLSQHKNV